MSVALWLLAVLGVIGAFDTLYLMPVMWHWRSLPTALIPERPDVPGWLIGTLQLMAVGVFASGLRDLYAALGLPYENWPWPKNHHES